MGSEMCIRDSNNIMESLRDLGPDSPYASSEAVSAGVEAANQPACTPLVGWHFTFGDGIAGQVTGPWGALSVVNHPDADTPVTRATTALLDTSGNPTGKQVAGAVTVTLSSAQLQLAERHQLWVQGGLVNDPVENVAHPGVYGFGALRCAMDNLNGDNVEWVGFPDGVRHVFCYAYYVKPPPTSGTIIVRKEVPQGNTDTQTFSFGGDVSYNPGGAFDLGVVNGSPAQESFYRAAGATPWNVVEDVPVNWTLQSLHCTSASQTDPSTFSYSGAAVAITLSAGDTATCTYVDAPVAPTQLTIRKVSLGGVGTFHYSITGASSSSAAATTTLAGVAVDATPTGVSLPGTYTITEAAPGEVAAHWTLRSVECDGKNYTPSANAITISIAQGEEPVCTFTNVLVPDGSITIYKVMRGGLGTAGFQITSAALHEDQLWLEATPSRLGEPARAVGDPTNHLALGTYTIEEFVPGGGNPAGWSLESIVCSGAQVSTRGASVTVRLTASEHHAVCTFTDLYAPATVTTTTIPVETTSPVTPTTIRVTG